MRPAADVLIVQFNILLKCQVACGDRQRDKTDADRRRNPSLTFLIPIFPQKTSLHLCLISWPGKGHTYPGREEAHRLGVGFLSFAALIFIWIIAEIYFLPDCFFFNVMAAWGIQAQLPSESPPALRSTWLSLRHEMRRKWKFLFRDAVNAEGSLLIQQLNWSFWTFQLRTTGSYILSQPPNWHLKTCDIYTYTPQLFLPDCLSSHLLPFLFFSSPHLHSAVVPLHPSLLTLLWAKTPAFHFGSV